MGSPVGYGGGRCPTAGSESAAVLKPLKDEPFILASMNGAGEQMDESTGSGWIYADGSAPSVVSGPSRLIGHSAGHGMIAAGDLNLLSSCFLSPGTWRRICRCASCNHIRPDGAPRMPLVGPQEPNGRQAVLWPTELLAERRYAPTFHHGRQTPTMATRQIDSALTPNSLANWVQGRRLNEPVEWGPSDQYREEI